MERSYRKFHPKISAQSMYLLNKINNFDSKLLILPNQLRKLAQSHAMDHIDESLVLLSETLFWEGYEVWKKRKSLVSDYWRNIAPKEWTHKERKLKKGKRKMLTNCKSPFHYCEKTRFLSTQRRSMCACSDYKGCFMRRTQLIFGIF